MSLIQRLIPRPLRNLREDFKEFCRGLLTFGVSAEAAEYLAERRSEVMDAEHKVYRKGLEILRETKDSRESDDELEREWALEFSRTLKETALLGRVATGEATAEERSKVLESPFVVSNGKPHELEGGVPNGTGQALKSLPAASESNPLPAEEARTTSGTSETSSWSDSHTRAKSHSASETPEDGEALAEVAAANPPVRSDTPEQPRRRGRPVGSRNRPKPEPSNGHATDPSPEDR